MDELPIFHVTYLPEELYALFYVHLTSSALHKVAVPTNHQYVVPNTHIMEEVYVLNEVPSHFLHVNIAVDKRDQTKHTLLDKK